MNTTQRQDELSAARVDGALGFWEIARAQPDRIAVVDPAGAQTTFGDLLGRADAIACELLDLGFRPGESVAILMRNEPFFVAVQLATSQIGLYLTAVNWHLSVDEVTYIVRDSDARALFTGSEADLADTATAAADAAGLAAHCRFASSAIPGFRDASSLPERDVDPAARRHGMSMLYTSGTTGRPKGVRKENPKDDTGSRRCRIDSRSGTSARHQTRSGRARRRRTALPCCTERVRDQRPAHGPPTDPLRQVESRRVPRGRREVPGDGHPHGADHVPPTAGTARRGAHPLRRILARGGGPRRCPVPGPREMGDARVVGADPVRVLLRDRGRRYISDRTGMGRTSRHCGPRVAGAEIKILDAEGRELPAGEIGGIYIRNSTSFEYYKDPAKTAEAREGDFFTAGDVGYFDEDGWLYLSDRRSDLIISGGVNIYPAEVEAVLLTHPAVMDAGVIGVPDREWGAIVHAVVEPAAGREAGDALASELLEHCKSTLARFKCPRTLEFRVLPRTPTGKLSRAELRASIVGDSTRPPNQSSPGDSSR